MDSQLAPIDSRKRAQDFGDSRDATDHHHGKRQRIGSPEVELTQEEIDELFGGSASDVEPERDPTPPPQPVQNRYTGVAADIVAAATRNAKKPKKSKVTAPLSTNTNASNTDAILSKEEAKALRDQKRKEASQRIKENRKNFYAGFPTAAPTKRKAPEVDNTAPASEEPKAKKPRKAPTCSSCGEVGHLKTNKSKCPALNGTWPNGVKPQQVLEVFEEPSKDSTIAPGEDGTKSLENVLESQDIEKERIVDEKQAPDTGKAVDTPLENSDIDPELIDAKATKTSVPSQDPPPAPVPQHRAAPAPAAIDLTIDETDWTARLVVNDILVGHVNEDSGLKLLKDMPIVKGPITCMTGTGFTEGELSIRKGGKGYLMVGGSVPTDASKERGSDWSGIDNYRIPVRKYGACKEIRVQVFEGHCTMSRDGVKCWEEKLESVEARKGVELTSDGSFYVPPMTEGTFDEWRKYSNARLDRMKYLRVFPKFPSQLDKCKRTMAIHAPAARKHIDFDMDVGCDAYKQEGNWKKGSSIGVCPHDLKHIIRQYANERKMAWSTVIDDEIMRFNIASWQDIEDVELRNQLVDLKHEYFKQLELVRIWLETEDMQRLGYY